MRVSANLAVVASGQLRISGPWDCHVYALRGPTGIVLIDAGAGTHIDLLLQNLYADLGTQEVEAVVVSHCHMDHCGGAASLRARTGCKVFAPGLSRVVLENGDEEAIGLRGARELGIYPRDLQFSPCPVDVGLRDGLEFEAANLRFRAIHVRGHSPDAFCFLTESLRRKWLFTGDTMFYGGILGVINASGSDMSGYRADLPKLSGLNVDGLFPGHGLFTLEEGQRHIDCAIDQAARGFLPRQVGQGDLIF